MFQTAICERTEEDALQTQAECGLYRFIEDCVLKDEEGDVEQSRKICVDGTQRHAVLLWEMWGEGPVYHNSDYPMTSPPIKSTFGL